jgi:hypothetical protein
LVGLAAPLALKASKSPDLFAPALPEPAGAFVAFPFLFRRLVLAQQTLPERAGDQ